MSKQAQSDEHRIILAGFGGQGILTLGKLLCTAVMNEGKQTSYLPSYGSEVRGGTANCHVVISSSQIFSPYVDDPHWIIILNQLSFERFGDCLRPGGLAVLNTSLAEPGDWADTRDVTLLPIPATETAVEMGSIVVANVLMLGAFLRACRVCEAETVREAIGELLSGRKSDQIEINLQALETGMQLAAEAVSKT